jgi:hypothetical protein
VEQCLNHAFDWQYTLQGFGYWSEIYVNIDKYLK